MKILTMGGATIFGYVGWFLGQSFGMGIAFVLSGIGSLAGVYFGWKLAQRFG